MKQGFVYIASLSHSGSTLLDLLLGNHPQLVGLGEIAKVLELDSRGIDEHLHMACTCGNRAGDCKFWGSFFPKLQQSASEDKNSKYRILQDHFYSVYNDQTRIVDSSKYKEGLLNLGELPNSRIDIIHLIKDVRSFTASHRESTSAELSVGRLPLLFSSKKMSEWLYSQSIKSPSYLFWKWYLRNRSMQETIASTNNLSLKVSYDTLAQQVEKIMAEIYDFLGVKKIGTKKLTPANSQSHIFMGNPMIGDPKKMSGVHYDDRWKKTRDWRLAAFLFPHIMAFNAKIVQGS